MIDVTDALVDRLDLRQAFISSMIYQGNTVDGRNPAPIDR